MPLLNLFALKQYRASWFWATLMSLFNAGYIVPCDAALFEAAREYSFPRTLRKENSKDIHSPFPVFFSSVSSCAS